MVVVMLEDGQVMVIGAAVPVGAWIWPSEIWVIGSMDMVTACENAGVLRLKARARKVTTVVAIVLVIVGRTVVERRCSLKGL